MAEPLAFPWSGQPDAAGCDLALRQLLIALPARMAPNGLLHPESLMAAAGSIAGLAAQVSLLADEQALAEAKASGGLLDVTLNDGRKFLYGDALNRMLWTLDPAFVRARLWNMLVAAAMDRGLPENDVPDLEMMFRYVTQAMGTDREGFPSTPREHQPHLPTQKMIQLVGNLGFQCLTGELTPAVEQPGHRASEVTWAAITAQAAASFLLRASATLPPRISMMIAMESAIYASKTPGSAPPPAN